MRRKNAATRRLAKIARELVAVAELLNRDVAPERRGQKVEP
jgi:hypothetical protein